MTKGVGMFFNQESGTNLQFTFQYMLGAFSPERGLDDFNANATDQLRAQSRTTYSVPSLELFKQTLSPLLVDLGKIIYMTNFELKNRVANTKDTNEIEELYRFNTLKFLFTAKGKLEGKDIDVTFTLSELQNFMKRYDMHFGIDIQDILENSQQKNGMIIFRPEEKAPKFCIYI